MSGSKALASLPVLPLALLVSLLFSLLLTLNNSQLNDDAFKYLRAAELFQQDGIDAVLRDYGWYGYSILMALADHVLPGGLDTSAQVLNALSYALLTAVFIVLQRESGAGCRQLLLAAGVVLLFPLLNEMRHFIIRDAAYWAFSMLAILQLARLMNAASLQQGLPLALAWCGSTLLASVFRLEALLPAVIAPLALLVSGRKAAGSTLHPTGLHLMLLLYALLLASAVMLFLLGLAADVRLLELMGFAWRYYLPLLLDLGNVLREDALALNAAIFTTENFPNHNNTAVGLLVLCFAYSTSVLINLVNALGLPFTLLLLLGMRQRLRVLPRTLAAAWLGYALPALLALLVFQFIMHFQTQRYAALLALLLLLWLPGMLEQWWQRAEQEGKTRRFRLTLAFFCFYFAVDSLVSFGYSKQHLEQAEQWLLEELPADAALASNSFQLAWRSGRIENYDRTQRDVALTLQTATEAAALNATSDNYLALELKQSDTGGRQLLEQSETLELVTSFSNERGDEVRIYHQSPLAR
jgi:hypothetical protein